MDRSVNRASLASTRSVSERNKMLVSGQISDHATSPLTQEPEEGDYMPTQLKAKVNFDVEMRGVELGLGTNGELGVGGRTVLAAADGGFHVGHDNDTRHSGQISDHATSPLTQEPEEGDYMPTQLKAKVNFDDNYVTLRRGSAVERFCFRWTDP
jgi:hypothetical protein